MAVRLQSPVLARRQNERVVLGSGADLADERMRIERVGDVGVDLRDVGEEITIRVLVGIGEAIAIGVGQQWIDQAAKVNDFLVIRQAVTIGIGLGKIRF